ncbi:transcriptional regulator [Fibrisoma montanum]|uniref:Transcriptional regulator n=2 Tax=Fibrisoma montanum TaxID=2305895 RepID=A0A418MK92_9BACT|nr:transcriptional regulator [Fibrisoma montanum]
MPELDRPAECARHLMPAMDTLELLGGKWKLLIVLGLLYGGKTRFKQLQKSIPGITGKVLSNDLKDLEQNGIITRTVYDTSPITVEYELTPYGRTLEKLILEIREWGMIHRQRILSE